MGGAVIFKLVIIADDFTGALDTGVKLSGKGISAKVIIHKEGENLRDVTGCDVLVVDTESRHIGKSDAFKKVYDLVSEIKDGAEFIYKKTDSALRGNVGAELDALMKALKLKSLDFVPALPSMNRITKNGIMYIDKIPVSKSVFGLDPFEPVTEDRVTDIIGRQTDTRIEAVLNEERFDEGILVYDCDSDERMKQIAEDFKRRNIRVLSGCSGLGDELINIIRLETGEAYKPELTPNLFVLCGSVNPITKAQVQYANENGIKKIGIAPELKLNEGCRSGSASDKIFADIFKLLSEDGCVILDSNDEILNETFDYGKAVGLTVEEVGARIANFQGRVLKRLMKEGIDATILVTGGDTLKGCMENLGMRELTPICEIVTGCVLTKLNYLGKNFYIITKSGGFGEKTLILDILKILGTVCKN